MNKPRKRNTETTQKEIHAGERQRNSKNLDKGKSLVRSSPGRSSEDTNQTPDKNVGGGGGKSQGEATDKGSTKTQSIQ